MWLNKRSHQLEWMDQSDLYCSPEQYQDALHQLGHIGRFLGGDMVIFNELAGIKTVPTSIIDVGCGGGHLAMRLAHKFKQTDIIGLDVDPKAIVFANKEHAPLPKNLQFLTCHKEEMASHLDGQSIVLASLMCHHLTDAELVDFIKTAKQKSGRLIILNDLHRHWLAYLSYLLIAPLAFRNRMILHDGLISIKRSFRRKDWQQLLEKAQLHPRDYSIRWYFPFRWGVKITCP